MRNFAWRAVTAALGALTLGGVGIGSATAADISVPPGAQQSYEPAPYGPAPYVEEEYVYRRPPIVYRPARPVYRYYEPYPEVVVLPRPYYRGYRGPVYRRPIYAARGYAAYGRHWDRGRRW